MASVGLRTRITVATRAAVLFGRIRATAASWIASSNVMTLITRRARHRIRAGTNSALASIRLRTRIAVITRSTVLFRRIRTSTRLGIACARVVTLVAGRARFRCSDTGSVLTNIIQRAGVSIITCASVGLGRI